MAHVIGFSAWSGTGKTTLLQKVIRRMKARGVRVAVVKHDVHGIDPCEDGKDSGRLRAAGVDRVALIGPGDAPERRLSEALNALSDVDIILVEGFRRAPIPRVGLCRAAAGKPLPEKPENYIAVVTDEATVTNVPRFGWDEDEELTDFLMEQTKDFTHFNDEGRARMVDVGAKNMTARTAVAAGRVLLNRATFDLIRSGDVKKGDVLTVAQVAGIMGAKRTPDLIPMCHPIPLDGVDLSLTLDEARLSVEITATVRTGGRTGVEMEALTAVSVAALTVYDMCKAVQRDMVISDIRLMKKTGGVHGDFEREDE
ncbi:MAG: cyclic pyranopterin monophosphate synthase MoaC [Clostridia bacterium]|nr:cyclic pyranopterin monophosphate synthase MoaC [Clostridia bacterium]